tara:strand:+ start:3344 stop:4252 length:909 start_codon:yes stop_codon:yes gene_type:complete
MTPKKITVKIAAGLGNQMFMYANAYALSKKYSTDLRIDNTSGFFQKKNRTLFREYGLDIFNLSSKISNSKDKFDNYLKHIFKKILVFFDFFRLKKNFFKEKINKNKISCFRPIDLKNSGNKIYIEGYFQSEKYFSEVEKNIKNEFTINMSKVNFNDSYKNSLIEKNSVSLHLRRNRFKSADGNFGDPNYKGSVSFDNVIDYVNRGIEYFRKNIDNPHFFIWSDNFEGIEKYFIGDDYTYIKGENIKHDFYLFQFAKNFIVSPSTFHWWGAWLNNTVSKICLRPKNINPSNNTDFWPAKWITI